ncbi:endonuclease/exonuclease/phosphatase family protein [Gallibacterium melopsittaci]|uniref:Endonuclease/exonuclease/phosphatase family protein n=1 Tax=Gallibacterium melopsittaci TaxID=516063 RepID=A0ABV6HV75_9PAST
MKNLLKKRFLFLLVLLGLSGFLIDSVTIYPSPYTTLISASSVVHHTPVIQTEQTDRTCYHPTLKASTIEQKQLRVVVWNLHKGLDRGWQQALQHYSQSADILLLQEVTSEQKLPQLLPTLPEQLFASPFAYRNVMSGVAQISKFVPQYYCSASVVEPWIRFPKASMSANYSRNNAQALLVINAHLINFEWIPTAYQQQLQQITDQIKQHTGPVLLAGDFNAWNQERTVLLRQLMKQLGLQEVQFTPDDRIRFNRYPLDYVFVRGINVIQAKTVQTTASDHNPLFIELAF